MKIYPQVGKSDIKKDIKRTALKPGWRTSKKSKKMYFENRANRSDKDPRKRL